VKAETAAQDTSTFGPMPQAFPRVIDLRDSLPRITEWLEQLLGAEIELPAMPRALRIEQFTENGDMVVRAEIPGIDPEKDVEITLDDGQLRIAGERRQVEQREDGGIHSEFFYGKFLRTIDVPAGVAKENIHAKYREGILEVRVGHAAQTPGGRIPVATDE